MTGTIKEIPHRVAKCPVCSAHGSWLYYFEGYSCSTFELEVEKCGIYGVEETGKCTGKNMDSGVSEKLLPTSALRH